MIDPVQDSSRIDLGELRDALIEGLAWFETGQPDNAVQTHHGIIRRLPVWQGRLQLRLYTDGAAGRPLFCFTVADPEYADDEMTNPLTGTEVAALHLAVASFLPVVDSWNGLGTKTYSVSFTHPLHPSLRAARQRYNDKCPTHNDVFCGDRHGCTWLRDGGLARVLPEGWF